jgi:hypothetical protein
VGTEVKGTANILAMGFAVLAGSEALATSAAPSSALQEKVAQHRDCIASKIADALRLEVRAGHIPDHTDPLADKAVTDCGATKDTIGTQLRNDVKDQYPRLSDADLQDATAAGVARFDKISIDFARSFARDILTAALKKSEKNNNAPN